MGKHNIERLENEDELRVWRCKNCLTRWTSFEDIGDASEIVDWMVRVGHRDANNCEERTMRNALK